MIFFVLFLYFSYIQCDCLEFLHNQRINGCFLQSTINRNIDIHYYYSECLQCQIETFIESENIKFEENNSCLTIGLQCIQLTFPNKQIFENFFQCHQHFLYDLFNKDNSTDQNTLHIIIKENTIDEIDGIYIENIFQKQFQAYRVLFFELHNQNQDVKLNRNLLQINRLSIKIILICGNETNPIETIYIVHNDKIALESENDLCSAPSIPSTITITSTTIIELSTNQILSISHQKSNNVPMISILLIIFLLCVSALLILYCLKFKKHGHSSPSSLLSSQTTVTPEEPLTSQDRSLEISLSLNNTPKLERSSSRMRTIQLFENDI